jgi:hypothetical protein
VMQRIAFGVRQDEIKNILHMNVRILEY